MNPENSYAFESDRFVNRSDDVFLPRMRAIAISVFVAVLLWAPFPLGSNPGWATGLLILLIAVCWCLWAAAAWPHPERQLQNLKEIAVPGLLMIAALAWAVVQLLPGVPESWAHPIWQMASEQLNVHEAIARVISINPWRTSVEIAKFCAYLSVGWIVYSFGRNTRTATQILDAVVVIGTVYAIYAFVLALSGKLQIQFFYEFYPKQQLISGPFMLHNSFASYEAFGCIAACGRLFSAGARSIAMRSGFKPFVSTTIRFVFGHGLSFAGGAVIMFAAVAASGSRAGFAALVISLITIAVASLAAVRLRNMDIWAAISVASLVLLLATGVIANSSVLADRYANFVQDIASSDPIRPILWSTAVRMIKGAPLLGLGLGTFQDAYPLYAAKVVPYVVDKAHCDYLEFAAGLGLPAAGLFLAGLGVLFIRCWRGMFARRRNRVFAVVASGATVFIALHSTVDFSLQMPAVTLLYVTLLALGVAQCRSSRA